MDQTLINWLLGGFGALIGFLLNAVWQAVKDLQSADKQLVEKVSQIEVLVAGGAFTGLSPADLAAIRAAVRAELHAELAAIFQIQTKVDAAL